MLVLLHSSYHSLTKWHPLQLSLIYFLLIHGLSSCLWIQLRSLQYIILLVVTFLSIPWTLFFYLCFLPYVDNSKQFSILLWNNNRFFLFVPPQPILLKKSYKTNWISFTFVITYRLSPSGPLYENCCRVGGLSLRHLFSQFSRLGSQRSRCCCCCCCC